jgi:nucleotide-binding universal stress UspA family protein
VLLATHGRGEIHRLLVGSVADRVIRMAPCPVFTLKEA